MGDSKAIPTPSWITGMLVKTPSAQTYICRDPREPPKTIILSLMTQEECPAMGGGPCVVMMQFHLGREAGKHSPMKENVG